MHRRPADEGQADEAVQRARASAQSDAHCGGFSTAGVGQAAGFWAPQPDTSRRESSRGRTTGEQTAKLQTRQATPSRWRVRSCHVPGVTTPRHRVLPSSGWLLVSTDLHGNLGDFAALERLAEDAWRHGVELHWAVLGDLVHGPDAEAGARTPHLYAFPDDSPTLVDALTEVMARHPGRVHFVLGNHDAGHLGFKHTSKFHPDEVEALEQRLTHTQLERLRRLCAEALLALVAPCGLLLTHGAPGDALETLAMLDGPLPPPRHDEARHRAVNELLWSYGQPGPVAAGVLERVSRETGHQLTVVVHEHDRDESGWFIEGDNQVQPVLFGAPREHKRYLWVDLSRPVSSCQALERDALRRLYPLQDGGD